MSSSNEWGETGVPGVWAIGDLVGRALAGAQGHA